MHVLSTSRTGVVGKNPQLRTDWQVERRSVSTIAMRDDAMLLVGRDHDVVGQGVAVHIAHQSKPLIDRLCCSAAIPRHRHPARIDNRPSVLALVSDHGGEHRKRDVVDAAYAESRHHQIEKYEHARAYFRYTGEVFGKQRGRRGADADHGRRMSRLSKTLRSAYRAGAFLFGHGAQ